MTLLINLKVYPNIYLSEIYVIQKDENTTWHYVYLKLDKVYWVGFSKPDIDYQVNMLAEIYRNIDNE